MQVYTQSMTELPTLEECHKIPILSSTCSTCPQPSYVSHCCAALTYKLRLTSLTFLVSFPNQIFRGLLCLTCEKFGLGMKLKKYFQVCSGHVTVAYVPTSSDMSLANTWGNPLQNGQSRWLQLYGSDLRMRLAYSVLNNLLLS